MVELYMNYEEPKFKSGDWIRDKRGNYYQVSSYISNSGIYTLRKAGQDYVYAHEKYGNIEDFELTTLEPDFRGPNIIKAFYSEEHKEVEGRLVRQHGINRVLIYDVGLFYVDGKKSRGDKHPRLFKDAYQAKAYFAEEAYQSDKKSKQLNEIMRSKHAN